MSKNVDKSYNVEIKTSIDDSSVMSKKACHYVSLPKVILRRIDDPEFVSDLKLKGNKTLQIKSKGKQNKVLSKHKITSPKIVLKNKKKVTSQTKKSISSLLQVQRKKNSLQGSSKLGNKSAANKTFNKLSAQINKSSKGGKRPIPKKDNQKDRKSAKKVEKIPQAKRNIIVKRKSNDNTQVKKKSSQATPSFLVEKSTEPGLEMSSEDEESMLDELKSDSGKSDDSTDLMYNDLIKSLNTTQKKGMSTPGVRKQALSKNVIKLSSAAKKTPGSVIKGGIIRKIPIQAKSKPSMKPNQKTLVNAKEIRNIMSGSSPNKQKMLISSVRSLKQKQTVSPSLKSKTPLPPVKQKAITVQSVEAINSKAKKSESAMQSNQKLVPTKQTATVTPLTKARKSFSTGPSKVSFNNKNHKGSESAESEPVNLLSKLVGLPISASKLQVVPLSQTNTVQGKSPISSPPLTNVKNNDNSKTQYVTPTTHEKESTNKSALDLLKILGDDNEAGTSQLDNENNSNGNEIRNSFQSETSMDMSEDYEVEEEKPRTIYDLIADINLVYPSWNLHIMPDTNTFCIAQIARGRLGIPVLKKCIELDEEYNAKVYVHQYHCKRFDGQYDSEESIIALIHEINALRA